MPTKTKAPDITHEAGAKMPRHLAELSDLCEICGPRIAEIKKRNSMITAFHKGLTEFGYKLTVPETAVAFDKAMAGPVTDADIIAMLIRTQLEQAGIVEAQE